MVQLSHPYMTTGKTTALTRQTIVGNVVACFLICCLGWSKLFFQGAFLTSWLQSQSAVTLESKKIKSVTVSIFSPSICHEVMGQDTMTLVVGMLRFKPTFSLSSFTFIKKHFSLSSLSSIRVVSSAYLKLLIFLLAVLFLSCASSSLIFHMMYYA